MAFGAGVTKFPARAVGPVADKRIRRVSRTGGPQNLLLYPVV